MIALWTIFNNCLIMKTFSTTIITNLFTTAAKMKRKILFQVKFRFTNKARKDILKILFHLIKKNY